MESEFERGVREFLARRPFVLRGIPADKLGLFCTALTHDSFSNETADRPDSRPVESYERLEFLGDAILEFVVCEHVYLNTGLNEGAMTDYKQDKVANARISERLEMAGVDIDSHMRVGRGHIDHRTKENIIEENMRSDSFEALLAAVYLTYGMDEVRRIVSEIMFR